MFAAQGHGKPIPLAAGQEASDCGDYGYLFGDVEGIDYVPGTTEAALGNLAKEMFEPGGSPASQNGALAPAMTYFGQFIDHDITGQSNLDGSLNIFGDEVPPVARDSVIQVAKNNRTGRLDLDSLYRQVPPSGNAALDKLNGLLRFHGDRAKMWVGQYQDTGAAGPILPADRAGDLLRLERLVNPHIGESEPRFSENDIDALPPAHRDLLRRPDGSLNQHRAIIGDARNDENLFVAQMHLAFLRFHNRMVDSMPEKRRPGDEDRVFDSAREQVTLHYQWLALNTFLAAVCDPLALRQVLAGGAALYGDFLQGCNHAHGQHFPMPTEFTVAAYRFGHSLVRGTYDWSRFFGREAIIQGRSDFRDMFAFTGRFNPYETSRGFGTGLFQQLPDIWLPDWDRLVHPVSEFPDRSTRLLDTQLSPPLRDMVNEGAATLPRNLTARNLRRGVRMNIPAAQPCIEKLNARYGFGITPLTHAQLTSGTTGKAIKDGNFVEKTPLWFYVLKEAEEQASGRHLGQLGTHIVAGTIAGLLIHDDTSYWNRAGSNQGRWHPVDGIPASGVLVDSLPALMRAALLI